MMVCQVLAHEQCPCPRRTPHNNKTCTLARNVLLGSTTCWYQMYIDNNVRTAVTCGFAVSKAMALASPHGEHVLAMLQCTEIARVCCKVSVTVEEGDRMV